MAGVFALAQRYVKKASKGAFDTKKRRNIRIVLKTPPGNGGRKPAHADLIQPFFFPGAENAAYGENRGADIIRFGGLQLWPS
jgi:hypothetical protein